MKKRIYLLLVFLLIFKSIAFAGSRETTEIAKTIAAEATGEGYYGMYLVSNTIKNRAILFNKSPFEVVKQKSQYAGFTSKNREKLYNEVKKQADYLAENLMTLEDKTNGAIYFENINKYGKPYWCKIKTLEYKNHVFYKSNKRRNK